MSEQNTSLANDFEIVEPTALDTISRAEIDCQITTAKKYPRQLSAVKASMLSFATLDEETAQSCFYTLPRGGKNIQGPSVRLAEIAVSCYKNLRAGSRVVQTVTTGDNPHVVVQSICHDLENNVAISIEKRRRIIGKKKNEGRIDEDDINLASNSCAAIAFRDAVFKVIPGALIKPVYEQAKKVAIGDAKTLGDRRARSIEAFGKMGVSKEQLLAKLEKKSVDDVNLDDMETLIGLYTAIKDGQTSIDEAFSPAAGPGPKFAPSGVVATDKPKAPEKPAPAPKVEPRVENVVEMPKEAPKAPEPVKEPEPVKQPELEPVQKEVSFEEMVDGPTESPEIVALREAMAKGGVNDAQVIKFMSVKGFVPEGLANPGLGDIRADKVGPLTRNLLIPNGQNLKQIKEILA